MGAGIATGTLGTYQYLKSNPIPVIQQNHISPLSSISPLSGLKSPQYGSDEDFHKAFDELEKLLGSEHISKSKDEIEAHSDNFWLCHHPEPDERPHVIAFPADTEEVSKIVKVAHKYRVPVVPYSGGTSLEGQFVSTRGGIVIDLRRLNKILSLHAEDLDITVQPAVGWQDLAEYLSPHGLLFGPDPGPGAAIGGMIGTSCSGTNAARYGTMKENVISITAVLPDGTIIKTKRRPQKSAAGYNLTGLLIGSEGTLGIVTEATLKLYVKPAHEIIALANFKTIEDACKSVSEIKTHGIQVNAVELLDDAMMRTINEVGAASRKFKEQHTLAFKIGGSKDTIKSLINTVQKITKDNGSTNFEFATEEKEKEELWEARKYALWSTIDLGKRKNPNVNAWATDVVVPFSQLPRVIKETVEDIKDSGLTATVVGHVGDGNFHAILVFDPKERGTAITLVNKMVERAIAADGTCTGEHGVGIAKRGYLEQELSVETIDFMRNIKKSIDPLNIFNPDKVFQIDPNEPNKKHHH